MNECEKINNLATKWSKNEKFIENTIKFEINDVKNKLPIWYCGCCNKNKIKINNRFCSKQINDHIDDANTHLFNLSNYNISKNNLIKTAFALAREKNIQKLLEKNENMVYHVIIIEFMLK